jgi:hypothetical protein
MAEVFISYKRGVYDAEIAKAIRNRLAGSPSGGRASSASTCWCRASRPGTASRTTSSWRR